MVRACFSEEQYRRSLNCHDVYDGFLTLSYAPSRSPDRYSWTAVWHEHDQPQGFSKAQIEVTRQRVKVPIGSPDVSRALRGVAFCGGPITADP
jgi:hypothetical protein